MTPDRGELGASGEPPAVPRQCGDCLFTDGTTRPVFEAPDGRQYVEDGGERVYGTWVPPSDEPAIVTGPDCVSAPSGRGPAA
jgi:hypothetical protein